MDPLRAADPRRIGPYRVEARLGAGGMGQVYLASSPGGRQVAVKVIRAEYAADPQFRGRFAREIDAARRVGGFHTAQVIDADATAAEPWMATAFVPGPSLRQVVARQGPMDPAAVRSLGAGLAEGLMAVHACGLVHRDLKPGNVIMSPDGPRIIDFGIARAAEATALTATGVVIGTFSFMSPEQVRADHTGPESDVFALGCVLTYAATGSGPFDAPTIPAIVRKITGGAPDLDGLTGDLRDLVEACLAKDPRQRPPLPQVLARLTAKPARRLPRRALLLGGLAAGATAIAVPTVLLWPEDASGGRQAPATPIGVPTPTPLPNDSPEMYKVAFTADGRSLVGAGFEGFWRWDLATATGKATKDSDRMYGSQLALSADGRRFASVSHDDVLSVWDTATGRVVQTPSLPGPSCMAFSPDARLLALGRHGGILVWDSVTGGRTTLPVSDSVEQMLFSPDGRKLALCGLSKFAVWDVAARKPITSFEVDYSSLKTGMAFSPDGRLLAVTEGGFYRVDIHSAEDGSLQQQLKGHTDEPTAVAFSPDGKVLVSGAKDKTLRLWHLPDGAAITQLQGDPDSTDALAFSPTGRSFASAGATGSTTIWTFR